MRTLDLDSGATVTLLAIHCGLPYAAETVGTVGDLKFTAANLEEG